MRAGTRIRTLPPVRASSSDTGTSNRQALQRFTFWPAQQIEVAPQPAENVVERRPKCVERLRKGHLPEIARRFDLSERFSPLPSPTNGLLACNRREIRPPIVRLPLGRVTQDRVS